MGQISIQGHHGRCSFCHGAIEHDLGGIATRASSGPPVYLCVPCAESGVVGDLLSGAILDSALLPAHEPGGKAVIGKRALKADAVLANVTARYRASLKG